MSIIIVTTYESIIIIYTVQINQTLAEDKVIYRVAMDGWGPHFHQGIPIITVFLGTPGPHSTVIVGPRAPILPVERARTRGPRFTSRMGTRGPRFRGSHFILTPASLSERCHRFSIQRRHRPSPPAAESLIMSPAHPHFRGSATFEVPFQIVRIYHSAYFLVPTL